MWTWRDLPCIINSESKIRGIIMACNCGCKCSDGTCSKVVAYKDSKGELHLSSEVCARANEMYAEKIIQDKIRSFLTTKFSLPFNYMIITVPSTLHTEQGMKNALEILVRDYRDLKKFLNALD